MGNCLRRKNTSNKPKISPIIIQDDINNHYIIETIVGTGCFGNVFQASHISNPTHKYAIKTIKKKKLKNKRQ